MIEDDIQYIGTRNVPVAPLPLRPLTSQQGTATGKDRRLKVLFDRIPNERGPSGVILHVEAHGSQSAYDIILRKSQTSSVTIGRKSSADNKISSSDEDPGNIRFHCQVVSSKHAKLAFTDSGAVYLIDLGSRHGTHLRRLCDNVSNQLEPEMPNILRDGDVITFGKSVGKGSYLVPPVTSRVELSFDSHVPDPSPLPRNIPDATQSNGNSKVHKPSTNRYGLVPSLSSAGSSSPSSDDDGSSRYDHDSDVEEIPQASFNAERVHNTLNSSVVLPTLKAIQAQLVGSALGANEYPGPSLDDVRLPAIEKVISIPRSHSPREVSTSPVEREFSFTSFFKSCNLEPYTLRDLESIGRTSEPNQSFVQVSRSPSPPSEFDLQGREKEAHVNMTEVNTAIGDMESGIASTTANHGSSSANTPSCGVDLEDCVAGTGSMSSSLNDRLDVTQDHVLDLQQHVTKLQEQADSLTPMLRDSAAETLAEVKAGVVSLRDLMTKMSGFHQEMEKQLVAELTSVEEARAALVAATSEAQTASRKRRRSEVDEDEASSSNFDKSIVHTHDCIHPPAKKRAKRIVSSLIHTATAVTVGAIATWTALAFS